MVSDQTYAAIRIKHVCCQRVIHRSRCRMGDIPKGYTNKDILREDTTNQRELETSCSELRDRQGRITLY